MRLPLPKIRKIPELLKRTWRWSTGFIPELPDTPEGLLPRAGHKIGFLRSLTAPGWRTLVRWAVVLVGFGVYIFAQLTLAYLVNTLQWWYIVAAFIVGACIVFAAWKPGTTFIVWMILSPFALIFLRLDFGAGMPAITFDRIVLLGMLLLLIVRMMMDRQKVRAPILGEMTILAFVGYTTLSLYLSHSGNVLQTSRTIAERFDHILLALIVYYIAKAVLTDRRHLSWCLIGMAITGVAVSVSAYYEHFTGNHWFSTIMGTEYQMGFSEAGTGRAVGAMLNPATLGAFLGVTAFVTFHLVGPAKTRSLKALYLAATVFQLGGCWFSYTRSGYLSAILLLVLMPFVARRYRANYAALLSVIVLGVLLYAPIGLSNNWLRNRLTKESTVLTRVAVSATMINIIKHYPLFGCGVGNLSDSLREHVTNAGTISGLYAYARPPGTFYPQQSLPIMIGSHNTFLTVAAEEGLIGISLYLGALALLIVHMLKVRRSLPDEGVLGKDLIAVLIVAILGHLASIAGYDISIFRYPNYVFWTMFAIGVRLGEIHYAERPAEQAIAPSETTSSPVLVHA